MQAAVLRQARSLATGVPNAGNAAPVDHRAVRPVAQADASNLYHRPVERLPVPSAVRAGHSPTAGQRFGRAEPTSTGTLAEL